MQLISCPHLHPNMNFSLVQFEGFGGGKDHTASSFQVPAQRAERSA